MLDLSVAQVAAGALAAVVGAVLASLLGEHGTIIGAAVVSTSATTGGAVFHHVFRRTGEEIRSRVPVAGEPGPTRQERAQHRADAAAAFPPPADALSTSGNPRTWKSYALATGLVFVLAMGAVTTVELIAGKPIAAVVKNEPGRGTSVGGGSAGTADPPARTPASGTSSRSAPASPSAAPDNTPTPAASATSAATATAGPSTTGP